MKRFFAIAVFACALVAAPAQARDYYYFHKAKVTPEAYRADREECDRLMGGAAASGRPPVYVAQNNNLTAGQNAAAAGIASLFAGLLIPDEHRRTVDAIERTCMADKGYDRYRVSKQLAKEMDGIKDPEARLARYFAMAAADEPVGERMVE
jgi:hypothetical protein